MIVRDDLDRRLTAWFLVDAAPREPEHLLGSVLARTARTHRRPAWAIPERWIPVSAITQAASAPRVPWKLVAAVALVLVGLAAGAVLMAGGQARPLAAPYGLASIGLAVTDVGGDIVTVDPVSGEQKTIVGDPATIDSDAQWSRDGSLIVFNRRTAADDSPFFYAVRADGGGLTQLTTEPMDWFNFAVSPDNKTVLIHRYLDDDRRGMVLANTDGSGARPLDVGMAVLETGFRPPDGRQIYFVGGQDLEGADAHMYLVDLDGTNVHRIGPDDGNPFGAPEMSPDGSSVAAGIDGEMRVYDIDTGADRALPLDPDRDWLWAYWSNDGRRVLAIGGMAGPDRSRPLLAAIAPLDGGAAVRLLGPRGSEYIAQAGWTPDDRFVDAVVARLGGRFEMVRFDSTTGKPVPGEPPEVGSIQRVPARP